MSTKLNIKTQVFFTAHMDEPQLIQTSNGEICFFTKRSPSKTTDNEDSIGIIEVDKDLTLLIIADGAGGHRAGAKASRIAIEAFVKTLNSSDRKLKAPRTLILDAIECAQKDIVSLGLGSATTLSVAEINSGNARFYHVGDSFMMLVGQKGKVKMQTTPHSPTGYAVASGLMDDKEAIQSEQSHFVSNLLGLEGMYIEMSSPANLATRDTLLMASDGLTDNIYLDKIIDEIRTGSLYDSVAALAKKCEFQMSSSNEKVSKPDDLSIILYRSSN